MERAVVVLPTYNERENVPLVIDRIIPVDIYIPGCPPRPEAVIDGLIKLQYRVQNERQPHLWNTLHGSGRKLD